VVGFDGSEDSRKALEWAADECELRRSALVVLHADRWSPAALKLPTFEHEEDAEEGVLEKGVRWARGEHPALDVSGRRVPPPAGEALVSATTDSLLLVVGSRGLGHLQQMLVGSVSRYCVEHAHCPVVVVRAT
jgi:nucleotide-binding universal stress UspA family protein